MKNEPSRTSGVEKCNNWNENFTRRIWYQIWTNRIKKLVDLKRNQSRLSSLKNREEKRMKKNKQSLRDLWENINCTKIDIIMEAPEGMETEKIAEGIFEEIII